LPVSIQLLDSRKPLQRKISWQLSQQALPKDAAAEVGSELHLKTVASISQAAIHYNQGPVDRI